MKAHQPIWPIVFAIFCVLCVPFAPSVEASASTRSMQRGFIASIHKDTKTSLELFAHHWAQARQEHATAMLAEAYVASHKGARLNDVTKKWLRTDMDTKSTQSYVGMFKLYSESRVSFYEKSHNWKTSAKESHEGITHTGVVDNRPDLIRNTYGFNVLRSMTNAMNRAMLDLHRSSLQGQEFEALVVSTLSNIMIDIQDTVHDDELRYYINQVVWHAANETTKQRHRIEPKGHAKIPTL